MIQKEDFSHSESMNVKQKAEALNSDSFITGHNRQVSQQLLCVVIRPKYNP